MKIKVVIINNTLHAYQFLVCLNVLHVKKKHIQEIQDHWHTIVT